jgi:hypothetical protein
VASKLKKDHIIKRKEFGEYIKRKASKLMKYFLQMKRFLN